MPNRRKDRHRSSSPGRIIRWCIVAVALLLSLAALIFQISADILPVVLLTVAAIVTVVNLLPKRDLGI